MGYPHTAQHKILKLELSSELTWVFGQSKGAMTLKIVPFDAELNFRYIRSKKTACFTSSFWEKSFSFNF